MTAPSVVHINVTGFMSAVELARDPALAGRPFAIAAANSPRALVLDCSPVAHRSGAAAGQTVAEARRRVPDLAVRPPDLPACRAASAGLERIAARIAPLVENAGGGHLYLDLGGTRRLFGPYLDSAARLRAAINEELGLDSAIALAANKLTARVASRCLRPAGLAAVRSGDEAAFLSPQDVRLLPGVGPRTERCLSGVGVESIGALAALDDSSAAALLGRRGRELRDAARGLDPTPVAPGRWSERVLVRERWFAVDQLEAAVLRGALFALAEALARDLAGGAAGRLELRVVYADSGEAAASAVPGRPAASEIELLTLADRLLVRAHRRRLRVRALILAAADLAPAGGDRDLFDPADGAKLDRLLQAVAGARRRFGDAAVTRGAALLARAAP